ncbi:hypothetical protein LC586_33000 [Nostoc sp. CHAB 5714]|uniref:ABC transmembrane type-1 domain-containing protein n=1 Tax=Nostoc favosum CHAB5714 TaxID=2780399 RepID=A0ABS8IJ37_9NOSO|nr:hypothetical protein [Nostoc favosum CHAB5714]
MAMPTAGYAYAFVILAMPTTGYAYAFVILANSYHVRQIAYDMSLRVQRSGAFAERLVEKQSQGLCDCFTSFAIDLCSTGHDIISCLLDYL